MPAVGLPPLLIAQATSPLPPLWQRVLWHVVAGVALCTGIALFLTLLLRDGLWRNWVFSLSIGGSIQTLIELGRYGISAWLRRRGVPGLHMTANWPGWRFMAPYVLVATLVGYLLGLQLGALLLGLPAPALSGGRLDMLPVVLSITVGVSALTTYGFYQQSQMAAMRAQAEAAQRQATDNQLRLLQSQLGPHMLFNTLANLRVLVTLDPPRAQGMLDHLIRYLRATLGASHTQLHPLATEFALLDDYLALMAVRMGPRLLVQLDLPAALRQQPVPPLLLQPLVENSIRHGLEPQVAGGRITVRAEQQAGSLVLTVRDTGVGLADRPQAIPGDGRAGVGQGGAGHGVAGHDGTGHYGTGHVASRLATLYGSQASFQLRPAPDGDGGTLAEVRLPLAHPPSPTGLPST